MRYTSSPDCEIYINKILAKELVVIDINEDDSIMPIYGWRNKHYNKTAQGNVLVTGSVIYNSGIPGYLDSMVNGFNPHTKPNVSEDSLTTIRHNLRSALATLAHNVSETEEDIEKLKKAAKLNRIVNFGSKPSEYSRGTTYVGLTTCLIEVRTPTMTTYIYDTQFSSTATQVDATRSDNIKVARSFIANRIKEE